MKYRESIENIFKNVGGVLSTKDVTSQHWALTTDPLQSSATPLSDGRENLLTLTEWKICQSQPSNGPPHIHPPKGD